MRKGVWTVKMYSAGGPEKRLKNAIKKRLSVGNHLKKIKQHVKNADRLHHRVGIQLGQESYIVVVIHNVRFRIPRIMRSKNTWIAVRFALVYQETWFDLWGYLPNENGPTDNIWYDPGR